MYIMLILHSFATAQNFSVFSVWRIVVKSNCQIVAFDLILHLT